MNIRYQRNIHLFANFTESLSRIHSRHRHSHNICTGFLNLLNLRHRCVDITSFSIRHGLHGNRSIATYWYITYPYFAAFTTFYWAFSMHITSLQTKTLDTTYIRLTLDNCASNQTPTKLRV